MDRMKPAQATTYLREIARSTDLDIYQTKHAREQMGLRDLIMGDVLHVLKHGFVYDEPEPSTQPTAWKYKMEGVTPNSGGRTVRIVIIPFAGRPALKLVTVMWVDEN